MKSKLPISFLILIAVLLATILAFLLATVLSCIDYERKYAMPVAMILLVAFGFSIAGAIIGIGDRSEIRREKLLNLIGVIGNSLFFLLILSLIVYVLIFQK